MLNLIFRLVPFILIPLALKAGEDWDTTAFKKYDQRLIFSLYQSIRRFDFELVAKQQGLLNRQRFLYRAEAANVTGLDFTWDKLSFSLDLKTTESDSSSVRRYGKTNYYNLFFGFGGNRMLMEFSLRNFQGFYDRNSASYISDFDPLTAAYHQDGGMVNRVFRARMLYFFNASKFSYRSAYSCNYRQLKSAASFLVTGNVYQALFHSPTGMIPPWVQQVNPFGTIYKGSSILGYNAGLGFSFNLVILKGWFLNGTFWLGPDFHLSRTILNSRGGIDLDLTFFGESRVSTGFNLKNFYFILSSKSDILNVSDRFYKISNSFISGQLAFGFRIPVRQNRAVKWLRNNRFYKML